MVYPKFVVTKFVSSTTVAALEKILVMLPVCGPVYDPDMSDGLNIFILLTIRILYPKGGLLVPQVCKLLIVNGKKDFVLK